MLNPTITNIKVNEKVSVHANIPQGGKVKISVTGVDGRWLFDTAILYGLTYSDYDAVTYTRIYTSYEKGPVGFPMWVLGGDKITVQVWENDSPTAIISKTISVLP